MAILFEARVLKLVVKIPAGRVTTYGELAKAIGQPQASRAVGNALNKNPELIKIPCHRVVRSDGTIGGYIKGGLQKKKLLLKEGVEIRNNKIVQLENYFYRFKNN